MIIMTMTSKKAPRCNYILST